MPKVAGVLELAKLEEQIIRNEDFLSRLFLDKALEFYRGLNYIKSTGASFTHTRLDAAKNLRCLQAIAEK